MKLELFNSYGVRRHGINTRTLIDWKKTFPKSAFLCIHMYVLTKKLKYEILSLFYVHEESYFCCHMCLRVLVTAEGMRRYETIHRDLLCFGR